MVAVRHERLLEEEARDRNEEQRRDVWDCERFNRTCNEDLEPFKYFEPKNQCGCTSTWSIARCTLHPFLSFNVSKRHTLEAQSIGVTLVETFATYLQIARQFARVAAQHRTRVCGRDVDGGEQRLCLRYPLPAG